jgi:3-hydroxyisobutyrate dehydrogenase-like beta-hydroxyacid dehydrogenase
MAGQGFTQVGIIGLGSMGSCLARRLLAAGHPVHGLDTSAETMAAHRAAGVETADSVAELVQHCAIILLALPTVEAFRGVVSELEKNERAGWIIDINTLLPAEKIAARDRLAGSGWRMLDCTISGTPEMVERNLHSFYVSGEDWQSRDVEEVIRNIAAAAFDLGEFGSAAAIKLIINHLVISHNVVAAEAMSLAIHAGLDPELVYRTVLPSAGSSRIFEVRGKMMVTEDYPTAAMYALIVDKDATLIAEMARELRHPVPMFSQAVQAHVLAMAQGWSDKDPASLCSMMEQAAGVIRASGREKPI